MAQVLLVTSLCRLTIVAADERISIVGFLVLRPMGLRRFTTTAQLC